MVTAQMVPSNLLIEAISEELKENEKIFIPPKWADYVKLGVSNENAPEQRKDWWYTRVASVLRKIYIYGPIGIIHLRKMYGGRKNRGSKPERARLGSGAVIRLAVHQLEKAGYITIASSNEGRIITPEGRRFVDTLAYKIKQELPELSIY
ncbi:MAG: 30S ribosomal protein S19e [Candidatus Heimdallarchaeota archaeon]|nr:30S ribosomal protein S19e [Candidatus Heimdallarchaeota archaeon]